MSETTMQDLKQDIENVRSLTSGNTNAIVKVEAVITILTEKIQNLVTTNASMTQAVSNTDELNKLRISHLTDSLDVVKAQDRRLAGLEHWQAGHVKWAENVLVLVQDVEKNTDKLDRRVSDLETWQNKKDGGYIMLALAIGNLIAIAGVLVEFFRK